MATEEQQRQIDRIAAAGTHYEVLDLTDGSDFSHEEVEKQYRQLARRLHPDKCSLDGAEEAFMAIKLAQDTLLDPEKRGRNDQLIRLYGKFRGDLDSNFELQQAGEDVGDLLRMKPEGGYCGALLRFGLTMGTLFGAFSWARLQVEIPAVKNLTKPCIPLLSVVAVLVMGVVLWWPWWTMFKWGSCMYYGWSAVHLVPWGQVISFQKQNADTLMGLPIWAGSVVALTALLGFNYDVLSAMFIGLCQVFILGLTCLRHGSGWMMAGLGVGFLILVAMADVDGAVAAALAVFIFFLSGGTMVYISVILLILYVAFRITPLLCIAILFAASVKSQDTELMCILSSGIGLISVWCYGLYWFVFLAIEGVVCKWSFGYWWPDRGVGHKWLPVGILVFAGIHGIAQASALATGFVLCGFVGVGAAISRLIQYENQSSRAPGYEFRKQAESAKRDKKDAKRFAKKEAKREQRKRR